MSGQCRKQADSRCLKSNAGAVVKSSESGFTVLELMIATVVSALLLLAATAAILQIGRMFYRGVISARTQESARTVMDEVSRPIQFSGAIPQPVDGTPSGDTGAFCIANLRYSYVLRRQVSPSPDGTGTQTRHALWRDTKPEADPCVSVNMALDRPTSEGQDLVGTSMRLMKFSVVPINPSDSSRALWEVAIKVAYGHDDGTADLFVDIDDPDRIACKSAFIGAQFCAVSELNTAITRRLR